jgi:hypothetical protein
VRWKRDWQVRALAPKPIPLDVTQNLVCLTEFSLPITGASVQEVFRAALAALVVPRTVPSPPQVASEKIVGAPAPQFLLEVIPRTVRLK